VLGEEAGVPNGLGLSSAAAAIGFWLISTKVARTATADRTGARPGTTASIHRWTAPAVGRKHANEEIDDWPVGATLPVSRRRSARQKRA
jgi:hypothetical protein